ncbi:hypothetical protein [Rickettsiella endosymbiont of Rhagonycha lignosa]|uniref:hypothetical protein n=1 Tax=Rickettsiella endosymbiont of Rhagonycha lignosa TaxID=3077937 RepID=UPI00313DA242
MINDNSNSFYFDKQKENKFLTRIMLKILKSILDGKPSIYAKDIDKDFYISDIDKNLWRIDSILSNINLSFFEEKLTPKNFSILYKTAEKYLNNRVRRFEDLKEDLKNLFPLSEFNIQINLEGCSDCCIVINKNNKQKLFVKSSKQDQQNREFMINCFISNILRGVNENLSARSYIHRNEKNKYLVSEDVIGIFREGSKFIEGFEYIKDNVKIIQGLIKKTRKMGELINYFSKEDLLTLGIISIVFGLADCHGHNIGIIIEHSKTDESKLKNRIVTFDLEMHKNPKEIRAISKDENLINYFSSNIQKYYNNAFLRFLTQPLKNESSLVSADDSDVTSAFLTLKMRLSAIYLDNSSLNQPFGNELDERGLISLIEKSIESIGKPKDNIEIGCIKHLNSIKHKLLKNYQTFKKAVMGRYLKSQDDLDIPTSIFSTNFKPTFFSQPPNDTCVSFNSNVEIGSTECETRRSRPRGMF